MPRISVIIPAFNQAHFLKEAVDSVLGQTSRDFEVIIVDDGSTDNTPEVVQAFADPRVRYIRQENRGLASARNTGITASSGEYIAFLDSDDTLLPHKSEVQARALDEEPELGLVASGYEYVDEGGRLLREERPWLGRPSLDLPTILLGGLAPVHAVMVRRGWLDRVGNFDASFRAAEDMDLWYRLSLAGCRMDWVPAIVCRYRIHHHNMSRSVRDHFRALSAALDKLFANRDLPDSIRRRRSEVYASKSLAEAGKLYGAGDPRGGKGALEAALREDPSLLIGDAGRLVSQMVAWEDSIWADNPERLLDQALQDLLPELAGLPGFRLRLQRTRDKARFYRAFRNGDKGRVRALWVRVAMGDWTWLRNRGNWSILLQSAGLQHPRRREARTW